MNAVADCCRRHWPTFRAEFGNFHVAPPYSTAMKQFLAKHNEVLG